MNNDLIEQICARCREVQELIKQVNLDIHQGTYQERMKAFNTMMYAITDCRNVLENVKDRANKLAKEEQSSYGYQRTLQLGNLTNELTEYIWTFDILPPKDDQAKQSAIDEWYKAMDDLTAFLKEIREEQVNRLR